MTATLGAHAPICLDCGQYVIFCDCKESTTMTATMERIEHHRVSYRFSRDTHTLPALLRALADEAEAHPERSYQTITCERDWPRWKAVAEWSEQTEIDDDI